MAIQVYEEAGSPTEAWTWEKGTTARRVVRCAWADRVQAVNEQIALVYPYLPAATLYVLRASIDAFPARQSQGSTTDLATYEHALLTLDYGIPEGGVPPGGSDPVEFATESIEPSSEFVTLNYQAFKWQSGNGLKPDDSPGWLIETLVYNYTRSNVTLVPSAVRTLVGKVNSAAVYPFTPGLTGLVFEPETLLYSAPRMNRRITSVGAELWDLSFRFVYRPNFDEDDNALGWNYFWNAENHEFEQLVSVVDGTVVKPYVPGNFLQIIL